MYSVLKRVFDIFISSIGLLLLSPFLLPIILLLRLTGEGEVWYFQERIGLKNKPFKIWKFATMLKNSPKMGTGTITLRNDPRVTPIGGFLRKTKINELPQIINVLIGEMSIVGPRPLDDRAFSVYSTNIQKQVNDSNPGITGIGSIIFRDEEKLLSTTDMLPHDFYREHIAPYKGELELWYQKNASMGTDLRIIFLTAWQILFPHSELVFKIFKGLPKRPEALKV